MHGNQVPALLLCYPKLTATPFLLFFFFNDTATTEIYTLSLHDALPISHLFGPDASEQSKGDQPDQDNHQPSRAAHHSRSEEHTSELQSRPHLVCRLLLEKKKKIFAVFLSSTNRRF